MTLENIKQFFCPYCTVDKEGYGKSFLYDLGFEEEELSIANYNSKFYIYCVTNNVNDPINGIQERHSKEISYCPMCGRKLKKYRKKGLSFVDPCLKPNRED